MLREMEEMETAQICKDLRILQNNLWVMLHRARMALRDCLERISSRINPSYGPMDIVDKSSSAENPSLLAGRNWFERTLVNMIAERTPKCREVVRLLSQSMEVKLPLSTRIKIRFHYLICVWCYRYGEQLQALRKTAASLSEHLDECGRDALPHSSKEGMKRALREKQHQ